MYKSVQLCCSLHTLHYITTFQPDVAQYFHNTYSWWWKNCYSGQKMWGNRCTVGFYHCQCWYAMHINNDHQEWKKKSSRTTMDLGVEMHEKVKQSLKPKQCHKSYADSKNLSTLIKGLIFNGSNKWKWGKINCDRRSWWEEYFLHNIEEVATVVGHG